jgi:hypothetical protein
MIALKDTSRFVAIAFRLQVMIRGSVILYVLPNSPNYYNQDEWPGYFCRSEDSCYVVRTLSSEEVKCLLSFLPMYYAHVRYE